jgi:hypothetical protein
VGRTVISPVEVSNLWTLAKRTRLCVRIGPARLQFCRSSAAQDLRARRSTES